VVKRVFRVITGLVLVVAILGGIWFVRSDQLTKLVNAQFPPVSAENQRQLAIATAIAVLDEMGPANVAASVDLRDLKKYLESLPIFAAFGIKTLTLHTDKQLMHVDIAFDHQFSSSDIKLPEDPRIDANGKLVANVDLNKITKFEAETKTAQDWKDLLEKWKPDVAGSLAIALSATSGTRPSTKSGVSLHLLPAFKRVQVEHIKLTEKSFDVTMISKMIVGILNDYGDNVSNYLSQQDMMSVDMPASLFDQFNPSQTLRPKTGSNETVTLVSAPISPPTAITAVAWMLDRDKVIALARFDASPPSIQGEGSQAVTPSKVTSMPDLNALVQKHLTGLFADTASHDGTWVALSKSLLVESVNSLFAQSKPSVRVSADLPRQEFDKVIDFPDSSKIDCTPDRQCSFDRIDCSPVGDCSGSQISCPANEDDRNCRVCTRYKVLQFRGLQTSWDWTETCVNNLACETAKGVQNGIYAAAKAQCEGGKATWKAQCEVEKKTRAYSCELDKSAQKVDCERIKTLDKGICESKKEAMKLLEHTGKFGRIDGTYNGTANLLASVPAAEFAAGLNAAKMTLIISGNAKIDTHIKFTPLDIIGHMACQAPFTQDHGLTVSLPTQTISVVATVKYAPRDGVANYVIDLATFHVKAEMDPSPTALLLKSTNFSLSCSLTASILNPLVVLLNPFIPELRGTFDRDISGVSFDYQPKLPDQKLGGVSVAITYSETGNVIVLSKKAPVS
jgi:hypothetical protein